MLEGGRVRSVLRHRHLLDRVEHPLEPAVRQNDESGELKSLMNIFVSGHIVSA
jgi:hypothetical protein